MKKHLLQHFVVKTNIDVGRSFMLGAALLERYYNKKIFSERIKRSCPTFQLEEMEFETLNLCDVVCSL